jgi:glyoxylase-like metal-dependent hydrolase (beta-lactamase superfamily II)
MPLRSVLPGVFLIDLPLVNVWLLLDGKEAVLIDTGTYWDRKAVVAALDEALPPGATLQKILLSHGHCDHTGNAAFLAKKYGAKLHAHHIEVPFIATRRTYIPRDLRGLGPQGISFAVGELIFPVRRHPVEVELTGGDRVETPIGPLLVVHTPGHTMGHTSFLHEEKKWLFSGDAIINVIPWVRKTALCLPVPTFSNDMAMARRSARKMAELEPVALLPGHGWPRLENTAEDLQAFVNGLPE